MRGGSRSGQACAFVRFVTPEGAIAAIQALSLSLALALALALILTLTLSRPSSSTCSSRP